MLNACYLQNVLILKKKNRISQMLIARHQYAKIGQTSRVLITEMTAFRQTMVGWMKELRRKIINRTVYYYFLFSCRSAVSCLTYATVIAIQYASIFWVSFSYIFFSLIASH